MRVTLHGDATGSAVAMLSTWDPMLVTHHAGLADLRARAAVRGLTPLALALDPAPALLLNGPARWPVHSDVDARVARLRACGVTVGVVHFERDDLGAGAQEFFDAVFAALPLAEFWLRFGQTVGSGPRGNARTVRLQGVRRRMGVRVLDADATPEYGLRVRAHLGAGAPSAAASLAGYPPSFGRPAGGVLRLAWAAGEYEARAVSDVVAPNHAGAPVRVTLAPGADGLCEVEWPDPAPRLEFVRGPGDAAVTAGIPALPAHAAADAVAA